MNRHRLVIVLVALTAVLLTACGSAATSHPRAATSASGTDASPSTRSVGGSLTVFAAASLAGTFTELGRLFQTAHPGSHVVFDFGASSTLAQQIDSGAPADVFASASSKNMAAARAAGAVDPPTTFARNEAEVAVYPGSRRKVSGLADLAARGVSVALCQPEVPCGALARTVLSRAGLRVSPVTQGLDVKAVLATVASGEVDAGIVYVTDVQAAGRAVQGVPIPGGLNASTSYPIATVTAGPHRALARAFLDLVLSAAGQRVLRQAGFSGP